jgi:hypothetical protein
MLLCVCVYMYECVYALVYMYVCQFVERGSSWKANSFLVSQEIPPILWKPEVISRVHNSPPLFTVMSRMNPSTSYHYI